MSLVPLVCQAVTEATTHTSLFHLSCTIDAIQFSKPCSRNYLQFSESFSVPLTFGKLIIFSGVLFLFEKRAEKYMILPVSNAQ